MDQCGISCWRLLAATLHWAIPAQNPNPQISISSWGLVRSKVMGGLFFSFERFIYIFEKQSDSSPISWFISQRDAAVVAGLV